MFEMKFFHTDVETWTTSALDKATLPRFGKPGENAAAAHELLRRISAVLDRLGVEYSLNDGTLLGHIREGGFIRGDNDMDLRVANEDMSDAMFRELETVGLRKYRETLFHSMGLRNAGFYFENVTIDLFGRVVQGGWDTGQIRFRKGFLTYKVPYEGRERTRFADIETWQPKKPEQILQHLYGQNWREPVKEWDHFFGYGGLVSATGDSKMLAASLRRWLAAQGHPVPGPRKQTKG